MKTSIRHNASFKPRRQLLALLIAVTLVAVQYNAAKISAGSVTTEVTVVLETSGAPLLPGTVQPVHNEPGNEIGAHVDCDLTSYTYDDLMGSSTVHYQYLSTGVDNVIPGNEVDLLSDVSGSRIAYTEVTFFGDTVRIFDTISHTTTIVPGVGRGNPSIGGNLVAFEERSPGNWDQSEIATYDLSSGTVTKLTDDDFDNRNAEVSPNGNAVIWEKCTSGVVGCDIYAAIQTSPGVFTTRALTTGNRASRYESSTNGEVAVYVSNPTGERDIYYQPLTGGIELHLSIAGDQQNPKISGDLISFEQVDQNGRDIFVYDIRSGILYQVTNTLEGEYWGEINVCGDTGRILYHKVGDGAFDLYGFKFQVPSVPSETQDHGEC